jgi:hypothetical protein
VLPRSSELAGLERFYSSAQYLVGSMKIDTKIR